MRRIIISAIAFCIAASCLFFSSCSCRTGWITVEIKKSVYDDAEPIYNDRNNSWNGRFDYQMNIARSDDAFYFVKFETRTVTVDAPVYLTMSTFKTIYRTDKYGTRMVYDGNDVSFQGYDNELKFYDGKLVERVFNGDEKPELWYLNEYERKFEKLLTLEAPGNVMIDDFDIIDGRLILFCSDNSLYEYKDGNCEKLPIEPAYYGEYSYLSDYCENGFYYDDWNFEKQINKKILYRYDLDKCKTVGVYDFGKVKADSGFKGYEIYSVVTDDYYYIGLSDENRDGAHCRFYRVDLKDMTADLIFETDEEIKLNAADDCAYVGFYENQKGLYKIAPDSNELIKLSDDPTVKIFITDDKWIYFAGDRSDIKRIRPDGEDVETVIRVRTVDN